MRLCLIGAGVIALTTTVGAQWLDYPTPNIPRSADGKPNLTAPTPRTADGTPDFSGLWTGPETVPTAAAGDVQPWVNEAARHHGANFYKDRPMFACLPSGPATFSQSTGGGVWKHIVQTPNLVVILNDDLTFRRIFMDGRPLEASPFPSWMGYSVGRWEGETLVVDSFGFNDRTWLNGRGLQHTEALRMTERYTRADVGHLKIDVSFADPGAYHKPLSMVVNMTVAADTEMLERVCERGSDDWVGTTADAQNAAVSVSPEILARYVGVYTGFWGSNPRKVDVALSNGQLVIRINDEREALPITPLSEHLFQSTASGGLAYDFLTNGKEPASDVVEIHVSGGYKYARRR
jgi:hypothetical protein